MRGGMGRRLTNPNGLTLIGSIVKRTQQFTKVYTSTRKPLTEEENRQIQEESERKAKKEKEAIKERLRMYPWACPYPDSVCTREQKEEIARITERVPESAPGLVKRYVAYVAFNLQHSDGWEFAEKIRIMHETIELVSRRYK